MKTVSLSFKRVGLAPGDCDADTMDALAQLAESGRAAAEVRRSPEASVGDWLTPKEWEGEYESCAFSVAVTVGGEAAVVGVDECFADGQPDA